MGGAKVATLGRLTESNDGCSSAFRNVYDRSDGRIMSGLAIIVAGRSTAASNSKKVAYCITSDQIGSLVGCQTLERIAAMTV